MQVPQAGPSQSKRVGVEDDFVNIKSSSNFKVMKKFIRSKIDNTEKSNRSSPNNLPDPPTATGEPCGGGCPDQSAADTLEPMCDNSPTLNASIEGDNEGEDMKKPKKDDGTATDEIAQREDGSIPDNKVEKIVKTQESTIMCRDFVRGTCKRPGTCKYAHKCDTSQLIGVYTFCKNYQNKVCTLPNCKYVHATVFEEQSFYRTGKLPPHVLAPKFPPPPPPPPPPPAIPESRVLLPPSIPCVPATFTSPPPPLPPLPPSLDANAMCVCLPSNATTPSMFQAESGAWAEPAAGAGGAAGPSSGARPPRLRCNWCEHMEFRVRYQENSVEKKRLNIERLKREACEIEKKRDKMTAIVMGLLNMSRNPTAADGPGSPFNALGDDKFKTLLEQLSRLNSTSRLSAVSEDAYKGLLNESLRSESYDLAGLLAKLLSDYQRQRPGGDASRQD